MNTAPPRQKTRWLPIVLSALVYPGAGQFAQKRHMAGFIYLAGFTVSFVWLGWLTIYPAIHNLYTAVNGMNAEFILPVWPEILTACGVSATLYVLNLIDVCMATRKASSTVKALMPNDECG